jgi:hypothetical protein
VFQKKEGVEMRNLLGLLLATVAFGQSGFVDTFDSAAFWFRTGGTGDGIYEALDGKYAHSEGQHCSYYRMDPTNYNFGTGIYEFDVTGGYWEFAWRVNSESQTAHRIGHYPDMFEGYFYMLGKMFKLVMLTIFQFSFPKLKSYIEKNICLLML